MASLTSLHQNIQQSTIDCIFPKQTTIDLVGGILCKICRLTFATKQGYDIHYRSHGDTAQIIYTCNICFKEIAGYPSFRGHCYTSHVIKERFQCEHCLKQFSKISNLKDHVNKIHKFKCPTCRKEFASKKEMQLHKIIHNSLEQPPYNCNTCKIEIDTADDCKEHVEKHLKFLYSCPICNDNISNKENAADHMKTHFGNVLSEEKTQEILQSTEDASDEFSGIMCQFCALVLGDRVKFDAHFSCKHGDEDIVYMCVECGDSFEKYSVFKNHCNDHSIRNRYKCELCKKSFPRPSMLAMHTAACQSAGAARGQKVFVCPGCSRRFASMSRWRDHLRVVHGMQRHLPCPHDGCDLTFDTPKQLILHQQSHEINNRNFCSQCRLVFSNLASCERHIDMHRKKVFFCPICKRNAKDKKVIMNHIAQHFEVVSHLCRMCGKIYNSKKSLIQHLKTHKKVKSYSCTHCNKSFLKPSELEQHVNTHTGVKPYKCPVCIKSFSNYPNWLKHVRRMHHDESIYIKNPVVDQKDTDEIVADKEDSAIKTAVNEKDIVKSNNLFNNEICTDNNTVNNYQFTNTNEQISNMNIDQTITELFQIKGIDVENPNSINNNGSAIEIVVSERVYEVFNDVSKKPRTDEKSFNFLETNHVNYSDINHIADHTVSIVDESSVIEITVVKENEVSKDVQMKDVEQSSIGGEQCSIGGEQCSIGGEQSSIGGEQYSIGGEQYSIGSVQSSIGSVQSSIGSVQSSIGSVQSSIGSEYISNIVDMCPKPFKCPICEKTFAKYSYMSKHVGRVHHIRSIDIKNLITDQKEGDDDESSIREMLLSEENEKIMDIVKGDNDDQDLNTEKKAQNIDILGSKPYKCPICDKTFAKYPYMTKHVRTIHHKKGIDIKNPNTDHTAVVDDISAMDTGVEEDHETFSDTAKDDNSDQFSNPEIRNIDKPHKCPICEKSFAKYAYMTKHVRKIHNKKIMEIQNILTEQKDLDDEGSTLETSFDGECDISMDNAKDDSGVQIWNLELSNVEPNTTIGPKPYKCPTCDKSFAKHSYLSKHVRTIHNKKGMDSKNQIINNREIVDDDCSAMETVDEENDIFTDNSKDDSDERISNADHSMDIGHKPYKCPMCEKSFAKDRYCRKHVRRIHYKKNMDIKSPIFDPTKSSVVGTLMDIEEAKSQEYLNGEVSNIHSISSIVNQAETTDCFNDIDNANASIDFANVRLENYIFSVQRDSPMDIVVPSMQDGKYLLNDSNDGNATINKDLFNGSSGDTPSIVKDIIYESKVNASIGTELVNENGEAIALVEKDLFNANNKETTTVEKVLFSGNSEENDNPIDILEYIAEMPENNSLFVPVISDEVLESSAQPPAEAVTYPCEYGPEFSAGFDAACTSGYIDLDDHMLPHIDPLLTINNQPQCVQVQNYQNYDYNVIDAADLLALGNETCNKMCAQNEQAYNEFNVTVATEYAPGWDPPIITKLCDQYAYGYGEMPEASRVPIMNTDIF